MTTESPNTAAHRLRRFFRRLWLLHRMGRGLMTVDEYEEAIRDE